MASTSTEPVITTGVVTAAVTAVITLLVALGLPIDQDLQVAILGVVAVAAPFVVAYFTRSKVTPASQVVVKEDTDGTLVAADASDLPNGTKVDVV